MTERIPPTPVSLIEPTNPVGEVRHRYRAERSAWTDRMLAALINGVKGGRWFSLIDKVYGVANLEAGFAKVKSNAGSPGADHVTIEMFEQRLDANLAHLSEQLRTGVYRPQAIRRVWIDKPGGREKRPLGIPTVRDRVVQAALRQVIEPIFEHTFAEHSYGFRPGRGCKDALRRVDGLLKAGYRYVVDADLKSYFDTIPHGPLMARLSERIADRRVLSLIESFLTQGVIDGLDAWTPEEGSPQGAVLSPLLANVYLNPLDHLVAERGFEMVRYADDFVILCRTAEEAQAALSLVKTWVEGAGLTLHPEKTQVVDAQHQSFAFLGYRFDRGRKWPRAKSVQKLKDAIRAKTRRTSGQSLSSIINEVNATVKGWFGYFMHAGSTTFTGLDGWIRGRLRSILRRRSGLRGRGRGADHQRWPNAYFARLSLFSMVQAHARLCQSARR